MQPALVLRWAFHLGLVTSGIYDDPLAIYREYIQNAVDELSRLDGVEGKVEITIDPRQKRVSICDNGPGLTYQECLDDLIPISQSKSALGETEGSEESVDFPVLLFPSPLHFSLAPVPANRLPEWFGRGPDLLTGPIPYRRWSKAFKIG